MTYTEIDFNGEKLRVSYPVPALKMVFRKLEKLEFLQGEVYNEVSIAQIIYAGHVSYCIPKELIPKVSFEQVYEWVTDNKNDPEELRKAIAAFTEGCKSFNDANAVEGEKKSQLTGKKSKKQHSGNSV